MKNSTTFNNWLHEQHMYENTNEVFIDLDAVEMGITSSIKDVMTS